MPSVIWRIEKNGGTPVTLESLGIRSPTVSKRSFQADEFTFTVPVADLFVAAPFAYGDFIRLYRAGVFWFVGHVTQVASNGSGGEESLGVTVTNNYRKLERIIYQQKHVVLTGSGLTDLTMSYTTSIVLGQDEWGRSITTDQQIAKIMTYALAHGSELPVVSFVDTFSNPPLSDARDITCGAAILRMVEWTPDAGSWFDYSAGAAVMVIGRLASLGAVTLDLDDKDLVVRISGLRGRADLKVNGVIFTFITIARDPTTGEAIPQEVVQTAGVSSGEGVIAATIQLAPQGSDGEPEPVPIGLATQYYNSLNFVAWEGEIGLQERECSGLVRPGQKLLLSNGRAEWATMLAVVQEVTEELDTGRTTIQLGLPAYLGANDFVDLMTKVRERPPASDAGNKQHNGTEGVPVEDGGDGGAPDVDEGDRTANPSGGHAGAGLSGGGTSAQDTCEGGENKKRIFRGI